jgi:hypothetical protein
MPTPPIDDLADDAAFELAFIAIIDDRLIGLRDEMDKLGRFRKRLIERQKERMTDEDRAA